MAEVELSCCDNLRPSSAEILTIRVLEFAVFNMPDSSEAIACAVKQKLILDHDDLRPSSAESLTIRVLEFAVGNMPDGSEAIAYAVE